MHALSGTLDHFMPVQILRLLQMAAATGRLELVRGDECAELFLADGRPSFARTTGEHDRVGDVLVDGGNLRPEAVELTAAVQQDQPGARIGHMLVESGVIEPEQLRAAVLEVQRRIVCRVLLWHDGRFTFHPGEHAAGEDITLAVDLDRLIIEALRLAESRNDAAPRDLAA
jgi:hypothetical protein